MYWRGNSFNISTGAPVGRRSGCPEEHARIRNTLANELRKPGFIKLIEGGKFVPKYAKVVSSTPYEILKRAADPRRRRRPSTG
jgi:hypothetical protein